MPIPIAEARVQWLNQAITGGPSINHARWSRAAVSLLLGHSAPPILPVGPSAAEVLTIAANSLDESQLAAMQRAMTSSCYVWGPPGTGKSRVLAWVAAVLIQAGRSVLLTGPTNRAVDSLLKRTRDILDRELSTTKKSVLYLATRWIGSMRDENTAPKSSYPRLHAATLARCVLAPTFAKPFLVDAVIVDEAAQSMLPDLIAAAACGAGHVVAGGDPRQLGPIVATSATNAGKTLRAQPFAGLSGNEPPHEMMVSLDESYRLSRRAIDGLRTVSYADSTFRAAPRRRREQLVRTDVGDVTVVAPPLAAGDQVPNGFSAGVLTWLLDEGAGAVAHPDVLVLAPTRADVRRLRSELANRSRSVSVRQLSTIHAAQGGEAQVVLVDATRYRRGRSFLEGFQPTDEASRLWNVALSRATHHVVLVVPPSLLTLNGRSWLERYIAWAAQEARVGRLDVETGEFTDDGPAPAPRRAAHADQWAAA